mgnify:CR=1 FL=1
MDIEERTASLSSPRRNTTGRRWFMSLATQRKGTIRRSKSPSAAAVAGANSSVSAMSICVEETRFVGTRNRFPAGPSTSMRRLRNEGLLPTCR